jgi:hypothetical protein
MDIVISGPVRSNLLILRGLRAEDFSAKISIFEPKAETTQLTQYTELPNVFRSVAEWSKITSNRLCWMCGLTPVSYPKFVPENPRVEHGEDVCDVRTHFCEWTCVASYVRREYSPERIPDVMKTVCLFESKFSGRLRDVIPEALEHTKMKPYSGDSGLTAAQYREKNAAIFRDNDLTTFRIEDLPKQIVLRKMKK